MKKLLIVIQFTFFGCFGLQGQLTSDYWTIGSQTGMLRDITHATNFNFSEPVKFSVSIHPNLGYFVNDDWVIGGKFGFGGEFVNGAELVILGLQAYGRNYFKKKEAIAWFMEPSLGSFGVIETAAGVRFGIIGDVGMGLSWLLWKRLSLDGILKVSYIRFQGNDTIDFGLRFGIQIYFEKFSNFRNDTD